jgi:sugar phosphate isomerase/epimerase
MNRRQFLLVGTAASSAALAKFGSVQAGKSHCNSQRPNTAATPIRDRICLFTDHLDDFGYRYEEVASMLKQLQIAGPDLTVRPGGLVPPERVADELPKAAAVFREHGLSVPMISTGLTSADDPAARSTLATMRKLGIRYFKLGYYPYGELAEWQTQLDGTRKKLTGLIELGREFGVQAGFHNHAGPTIGGALWDSWQLVEPLDVDWVGFYYDPAQATIEGGNHAWKLGLQRIAPRLKMIAIKDFVWEKVDGQWRTRWCALGEGMVRWPEFFEMLTRLPFDGPISLHIEYDPGGSTRATRLENSLTAAQRDLKFLREQLDMAFGS